MATLTAGVLDMDTFIDDGPAGYAGGDKMVLDLRDGGSLNLGKAAPAFQELGIALGRIITVKLAIPMLDELVMKERCHANRVGFLYALDLLVFVRGVRRHGSPVATVLYAGDIVDLQRGLARQHGPPALIQQFPTTGPSGPADIPQRGEALRVSRPPTAIGWVEERSSPGR